MSIGTSPLAQEYQLLRLTFSPPSVPTRNWGRPRAVILMAENPSIELPPKVKRIQKYYHDGICILKNRGRKLSGWQNQTTHPFVEGCKYVQ